MVDLYEKTTSNNQQDKANEVLAEKLANRAARRYVGQKDELKNLVKGRSGMAYLGAAGWYIPVPTVLGALLGQWLDIHYPYKSVSWSLNMILLGLCIGMINMWCWLKREGIDYARKEQDTRDRLLEKTKQDLSEDDKNGEGENQ